MVDKEIRVDRFVHSSRKTIGLEITDSGELVVRAPYHLDRKLLLKFLDKKAEWIFRKQKTAKKRANLRKSLDLEKSNQVLLLGRYYPVERYKGKKVFFNHKFFIPDLGTEKKKEALVRWLKDKARKYLNFRVNQLAGELKIDYRQVRITSAKKRWGSCSAAGNLNFTYRLIMAPPEVIDYVIVHELIHIRYLNHSRRFWKEVAIALPDYKQQQKWLKDNGFKMVL